MGWKGDWRKREVEKAKGRERERESFFSFSLCHVDHLGLGRVLLDRCNNSSVYLTTCQLWEGVYARSDPFDLIASGNFHFVNEDFLGEASPPEDPISGPVSGSVLSHSMFLILCNPMDCSLPGFSVPGAQEYWSRLPIPTPRLPGRASSLLFWLVLLVSLTLICSRVLLWTDGNHRAFLPHVLSWNWGGGATRPFFPGLLLHFSVCCYSATPGSLLPSWIYSEKWVQVCSITHTRLQAKSSPDLSRQASLCSTHGTVRCQPSPFLQDTLHSAWSSLAAAHAPPSDKRKAGNSDHSSLPRLLIGARKNVRVGGWLSVIVWVLSIREPRGKVSAPFNTESQCL